MSSLDFLGKKKELPRDELIKQLREKQEEIKKRLEDLESNLIMKKSMGEEHQRVIDRLLNEIYANWKAAELEKPKTSKQKSTLH